MSEKPPLQSVLAEFMRAALGEVHVAIPAKVVAFDDSANTVDVEPVTKRRVRSDSEGTVAEKMPVIQDVKIAWPCSNNCYIKWPIPVGSFVQLLFNDRSTEVWRDTSQSNSEPGDLAEHDMSYPTAIPGLRPDVFGLLGQDIPAVGSAMVLEAPEVKIGEGATDYGALATKVNDALSTIYDWMGTHVHSGVTTGPGSSGPSVPPGSPFDDVKASKTKIE